MWGANSAGEYDYSFQSGQIGEAFFFDGYTTYLNVNASASLNVGANGAGLTLACWLKPGDFNPHPMIEWNNGATNGTYFWMSNTLYANFKDTSGNNHIVCAPPNLLTTNAFQYAVATYDGTYGVIYLNGTNLVTTNLGSFTPQTGYNLYFGFRPAGGIAYYYGLLDELSLYKRALTSTEVNTLYLAGAASNSVCAGTPPTLSPQPVSQTLTAGNDAQPFTVGATGIGPFSYQWYYNGGVIAGATGTALSLLNVPTNQSGYYSVIVSSSGGSTSSSNAVLTATNAVAVARPANLVAWWQGEGNALDTYGVFNGVTNGNATYQPVEEKLFLKDRKIQPKVSAVPFVTPRANLKPIPPCVELCFSARFVLSIRNNPHPTPTIVRQTRKRAFPIAANCFGVPTPNSLRINCDRL